MRRLNSYIRKHGLIEGRKLYTKLQKEAAAASAVARQKKKMGL